LWNFFQKYAKKCLDMKIPNWINRPLTALYLRRRRVEWRGELPQMNMLRPPNFAVYGKLILGSGVKFFTHLAKPLIQVDRGAIMMVGDQAVFNCPFWIRAGREIVIGDHALIAPGVKIFDHNMHPVFPGDKQEPRPVGLGRNVWVGIDSIILPGVCIGEHSVVAAGSVVTRSFPARTVIAGNPAKQIAEVEFPNGCSDKWIRGDH
jgi:acetyltransferase-like isoleucine patch superfamily enzyme